ncbi:DUF4105 domain-containing protein [Halobacteriovorax sp. XZX-3]|uniref:Lnb N-terminal periplasmic domain-containing protein n=1 Tax=unclassified Halobacteriovorax TaxID=2639665 RepID=UPI000CD2BE3D|nr:DUF4105 domain-containing protein [Halobacteriovorax sp. DA5]POB12688.1 hypothetical protein C0Z22_14475 [Halobacteriovorax sp. DA5]
MKKYLTATFLFFALGHSSWASTELETFSKSQRWLKLIRYEKNLFGYESLVKAKEYFLSENGMTSPLEELKQTISGVESPLVKDMNNHPKCLFPARFMLLKEHRLIEQSLNLYDCPAYQDYIKKIDIYSVSIIFSSYFIEKPASTFGHTFFRVRSKSSKSQDNDLLDYGVDFSAKVDTSNPLVYGYKGIFGGFKGMFAMMPYYVKVKEYNNMESRDLWDYELNLDRKDLIYFQAHLFEMNRAYFDYLYFTKNCSYHILAFVDAIRTDWKLIDNIDTTVPPVDTIYALFEQDNIVKNIKVRPASYTKLKARYDEMNPKQGALFKKLIKDSKNISDIKDNVDELFVLDTYNLYIDFKNADVDATKSLKDKEKKEYRTQKFRINSKRAKLASKSQDINYDFLMPKSPDKGHSTNRFSLGPSFDSNGEYLNIEFRGALHDLLDRQSGYLPMSTTELVNIKLDYNRYQEDRLRLVDIQLARIDALRPVTVFAKKLSWQFNFGFAESFTYQSRTLNPYLDFDLGYTFGNEVFALAAFIATQNSYIYESDYDYALTYGPKIRLIYSSKYFSWQGSYQYSFRNNTRLNKQHEWNSEAKFHFTKDVSLRLAYQYYDEVYQRAMAGLNFFY